MKIRKLILAAGAIFLTSSPLYAFATNKPIKNEAGPPYNWSDEIPILGDAEGLNPSATMINGNIFYTYMSGGNTHYLFYRIGTPTSNNNQYGYTWSNPVPVAGGTEGLNPTVTTIDGMIFYAYMSGSIKVGSATIHKLMFRLATPGTQGGGPYDYNWSPGLQVDGDATGLNPTVTIIDGKVFYAYMSEGKPHYLHYRIGSPGLQNRAYNYTWTREMDINNTEGLYPTVTTTANGKIFYAYMSGGKPHNLFYSVGTPINSNDKTYSWRKGSEIVNDAQGLTPTVTTTANGNIFYTYMSGGNTHYLFYRTGTPTSAN